MNVLIFASNCGKFARFKPLAFEGIGKTSRQMRHPNEQIKTKHHNSLRVRLLGFGRVQALLHQGVPAPEGGRKSQTVAGLEPEPPIVPEYIKDNVSLNQFAA